MLLADVSSLVTAWDRPSVHPTHRHALWRVLRRQLAAYEPAQPDGAYVADDDVALDSSTRPKFAALEPLLWVRLSDLLDAVPRYPHLHGIGLEAPAAIRVISAMSLMPLEADGSPVVATMAVAAVPGNGHGAAGGLPNGIEVGPACRVDVESAERGVGDRSGVVDSV